MPKREVKIARQVRFTPEQAAAQEALERSDRPLQVERHEWLTKLYEHFRGRHFPGMPAAAIGIDYRSHYFVLGSYDCARGIVLRNNPAVISSHENCAHILLHEMTHQWMHWMKLDDGSPAPGFEDPDPYAGHPMRFHRKLRAALAAEFPGTRFPDAGKAKLTY